MPKRVIQGKVIRKSGDKTASLLVERKIMHPKYRKFVKKSKTYLIHDSNNETKVDDLISAIECSPISKRKCFRLNKVIVSANIKDVEVVEDSLEVKGES